MKTKKAYAILIDNSIGESSPMFYSIWEEKEDADKEIERLNNSDLRISWSVGDAQVYELEINKQYDNNHYLPYK